MRRVLVAPCPLCSEEIQYIYETERIPYFSEILIAQASCKCGFKSVDVMVMGDSNPLCYTLAVGDEEDLTARVVRSGKGVIEIPEFGVRVDPGGACEAFVSNVEGVLLRVESVIDGVLARNPGDDEKINALALKERIEKARSGNEPFTLIIYDPTGNSGIVSKKAVKSGYPTEEEDSGH